MTDFNKRVRLKQGKQKEIFEEYLSLFDDQESAALSLGLKHTTFSAYKREQSKTVPLGILTRVADLTQKKLEDILLEEVTLKGLRAESLNNYRLNNPEEAISKQLEASRLGVKSLNEKYSNNRSMITYKSRLALKLKYGPNAYSILSRKGIKALKEKYGPDAHKITGRMSWEKLVNELGEEGAKAYRAEKFEEGLIKKYGSEFRKTLGKLGTEYWKENYGFFWTKEMTKNARKKRKEIYGPISVSSEIGRLNLVERLGEEGAKNVVKERMLQGLIETFGYEYNNILSAYRMLKNRGMLSDEISLEFKSTAKLMHEKNPESIKLLKSIIKKSSLENFFDENAREIAEYLPKTLSSLIRGVEVSDEHDYDAVTKIYSYLKKNPEKDSKNISIETGILIRDVERVFYKNNLFRNIVKETYKKRISLWVTNPNYETT